MQCSDGKPTHRLHNLEGRVRSRADAIARRRVLPIPVSRQAKASNYITYYIRENQQRGITAPRIKRERGIRCAVRGVQCSSHKHS